MRELRAVDFKIYVQALGTYFKNPVVALAPLAAGLANVILSIGLAGGMIAWLLSFMINLFGLAVAVIFADYAWRARSVSMSQVWDDTRRKAGDILLASIGALFLIALPSLFLGIFGTLVPIFQGIACTFAMYAIPAAAIGGTPGAIALQNSVDRTRAFPVTTVILFLACYGAYACAPLLSGAFLALIGSRIDAALYIPITLIVSAVTQAFSLGYIALVLAKVYTVTSYGRRF